MIDDKSGALLGLLNKRRRRRLDILLILLIITRPELLLFGAGSRQQVIKNSTSYLRHCYGFEFLDLHCADLFCDHKLYL